MVLRALASIASRECSDGSTCIFQDLRTGARSITLIALSCSTVGVQRFTILSMSAALADAATLEVCFSSASQPRLRFRSARGASLASSAAGTGGAVSGSGQGSISMMVGWGFPQLLHFARSERFGSPQDGHSHLL